MWVDGQWLRPSMVGYYACESSSCDCSNVDNTLFRVVETSARARHGGVRSTPRRARIAPQSTQYRISDTEQAHKYAVQKQAYHAMELKAAEEKKKAAHDAAEEHKVAEAHKKQAQHHTELAKQPGENQKHHKNMADEYEKKYLESNYKAKQDDMTCKKRAKYEMDMQYLSECCFANQRDFERKVESKKPGYVYYGQPAIKHPGIMQWNGLKKHSRDEGRSDSSTILARIRHIQKMTRFSGDETNQEMYEMLVVTARKHDAQFFVRLLYYTDWRIFGPTKTKAVIIEVIYNKFQAGIEVLLENSAEVLLDNYSIQDLKNNSRPLTR